MVNKTLIHSERLAVRGRAKVRDGIALAASLCFATLCKARIVVAAILVAAGLLAVTPHSAAATTSQTIDLAGQVFVEPGDPACPSGSGTDTFTYRNGFVHVVIHPDGTVHLNGTGEGPFTQAPFLDPSVPTCSGHFAFWCGMQVVNGQLLDDQFTVDMHTTCANGSMIDIHWTGKVQFVNGVLHKTTGTFNCH